LNKRSRKTIRGPQNLSKIVVSRSILEGLKPSYLIPQTFKTRPIIMSRQNLKIPKIRKTQSNFNLKMTWVMILYNASQKKEATPTPVPRYKSLLKKPAKSTKKSKTHPSN
jgi:hypothetical protein